MGEEAKSLYACCPICTKPIGKSKRCDGMELTCPKCNSLLKVNIGQDAKVSVELIKDGAREKTNKNSVAPRIAGLG